jgi:hypothetical protein
MSMEVLHGLVSAELELWEGYLVSSTSQGCLIAAFVSPARAIRCVLVHLESAAAR